MGIPAPLLSQWASGARPVPLERCADIEKATGGRVTRRDLRPEDWERHWPELMPRSPTSHPGNRAGDRRPKKRSPDRLN